MDWQEILGYAGGTLITAAFLPQVWRLFRYKSARDISLPFNLLFIVGGLCWLAYGIVFRLPPVIISNMISLLLVGAMLYAKLKYGRT